jgi:hypothetical protein
MWTFAALKDNISRGWRDMTRSTVRPETWEEPDAERRYNETTWVSSHDAYHSSAYGYWIALHKKSIKQQLESGVRSLDLRPKYCNDSIVLCHGDCDAIQQRCLIPLLQFSQLKAILQEIVSFLKNNSEAIITIQLSNSDHPNLINDHIEASGITHYLLKKKHLSKDNTHYWPKLGFMREKNRRVVIFSDELSDDPIIRYGFHKSDFIFNYPWNTSPAFRSPRNNVLIRLGMGLEMPHNIDWNVPLDMNTHRPPMENAEYMSTGYIQRMFCGDPSADIRNSQSIHAFLNNIETNGVTLGENTRALRGKYPNFLFADHTHVGALINAANTYNQKTATRRERKKHYGLVS